MGFNGVTRNDKRLNYGGDLREKAREGTENGNVCEVLFYKEVKMTVYCFSMRMFFLVWKIYIGRKRMGISVNCLRTVDHVQSINLIYGCRLK